ELMARVRKCPAISYLVVAIFPLIPGAGVYYTMRYAVLGQMDLFASQLMHTAAIAGIMAVAILLVSTSVRLWFSRKIKKV
ncbi:MAG: threonine/serine exporter family protein, partial [Bacteroidales bacterium]|nr:threonine/serine exporter family protein [Bacteroidales bacterium]